MKTAVKGEPGANQRGRHGQGREGRELSTLPRASILNNFNCIEGTGSQREQTTMRKMVLCLMNRLGDALACASVKEYTVQRGMRVA